MIHVCSLLSVQTDSNGPDGRRGDMFVARAWELREEPSNETLRASRPHDEQTDIRTLLYILYNTAVYSTHILLYGGGKILCDTLQEKCDTPAKSTVSTSYGSLAAGAVV